MSLGGRVVVVIAPGVSAELPAPDVPAAAATFSRIETPRPADWPWPIDRYGDLDPSPIWLSYQGEPKALSLDVSPRKAIYHSETYISSYLGRTGVSYHSSVRLEVVGGLLDVFELLVPPDVQGDWSIEGLDVASRYPVLSDPTGQARYRIVLAQKGNRIITFRLHYSTKFDAPLSESVDRAGRLARIRPAMDAIGPVDLVCDSAPGVRVEIDAPGWEKHPAGGATDSRPSGRRFSRREDSSPMPDFRATAEPIVPLPELVVSRAHLKTSRGSDELRTTASFRLESYGASVVIAVPEGSRWVRARLDGEPVIDVERAGSDRYRLSIPPAAAEGPRIIVVETASSAHVASAWQPPTLVGADVQECYWTVVVPMSYAVVGTPRGWCDENGWRWSNYIWMKTPLRGAGELERWVLGESGTASDPGDDPSTNLTNQHAFLFRRSDGLAPLALQVLPRSLLLVICSGVVSFIGLGLVLMSPDRRPSVALALAVVLGFAAACDTDLTLQLLPCGVLGLILTLVAAAIQWAVNRRRKGGRGRITSAPAAMAPSIPSAPLSSPDTSSDDSTAIRARPPEVVDMFAGAAAAPDAAPSLSEMGVRP